jgi:hypothetical protein
MKKIILILITVLALNTMSGQYYYVPYLNAGMNPGNLNKDVEYPVGGGIAAGWSTLIAGNQVDPIWSSRKKLPFTFNFNGTNYDSIWVSTSGVVTFSRTVDAAPAYDNAILPDATIPDNSACIRGIVTEGANQGFANVVTKTFGTAGKRQFYITYSAYNELSLGNSAYLWVSIVLEEGSNAIYFIDQRKYAQSGAGTNLTIGVQINSTEATTVAGSPSVKLTAATGASEIDNSYYKFVKGPQPAFNTEGAVATMPDYLALTKAPFVCSGSFKNIGTTAITSCDINYSINNGAPVTIAAASVSIAKNGTATVTSPTTWTPSAVGTYKVTVWLSNLNGNPDEEGFNDSITKNVIVVEDYVVRMPLHEVFTSSTCGPCVPGNKNTDEVIFPQFPDQFTVIKYQMSWPGNGDPYTTPEGNVRRTLYGVNSIPNMQVDGGWNGNASLYTANLFTSFQAKPSFIKIDATHTINFKKVIVNVKITPLTNYNNPNLRLFVAICEKTTYNNVKSNGETEFHHVLKKFLPDANGTAVGSVTKNTEKIFNTFNFTVPGVTRLPIDGQTANIINVNTENSFEELQDCEVIVFVQDLSTKEVYQSANSVGTVLSIDDVNNPNDGISIYPNPSVDGLTYVKFNINNTENVKINVYNTLGQVVETINSNNLVSGKNVLQINTDKYAKGMYTIQIDGNGFTASEKFIVQ